MPGCEAVSPSRGQYCIDLTHYLEFQISVFSGSVSESFSKKVHIFYKILLELIKSDCRIVEYCDEYVCLFVCLSVCLSVCP